MHEFSLMQSVLDTVSETAANAGATKVLGVRLVIGDIAEVVADAMEFAFEALTPDTICAQATLSMEFVRPRSRCTVCDAEFEHDRYHWSCPKCDSLATELICGRELYIDSIEIEEDDSDDQRDAILRDELDVDSDNGKTREDARGEIKLDEQRA